MPKGHKKKSKYNSIKLFQVHNGGEFHIQTFAKGQKSVKKLFLKIRTFPGRVRRFL